MSDENTTMKDRLVSAFKETGDVAGGVVNAARDTAKTALEGVGDVAASTFKVAGGILTGAMQAASSVGEGLIDVVRSTVVGVLTGIGEIATVTVGVVRTRSAPRSTERATWAETGPTRRPESPPVSYSPARTSANEPLSLSDGALLALTMSVFTDRTGYAFGQRVPIPPDQSVDGDPVDAAAAWLHDQSPCAHP